jgi:hypothetical protein
MMTRVYLVGDVADPVNLEIRDERTGLLIEHIQNIAVCIESGHPTTATLYYSAGKSGSKSESVEVVPCRVPTTVMPHPSTPKFNTGHIGKRAHGDSPQIGQATGIIRGVDTILGRCGKYVQIEEEGTGLLWTFAQNDVELWPVDQPMNSTPTQSTGTCPECSGAGEVVLLHGPEPCSRGCKKP